MTDLDPRILMSCSFYTHFHPLFPILPDKAIFLSKYNANKLLLWAVLAISSKESVQQSHLYPALVDPVRRLAGDLYSSQSRNFETVQGLLLLCLWAFPFQQTVNDPSPMYCALATQIAYQLGLHRPSFTSDFAESRIPQGEVGELARTKVWFGCFIVSYG
jgi:Fungal specific transcription factor domain